MWKVYHTKVMRVELEILNYKIQSIATTQCYTPMICSVTGSSAIMVYCSYSAMLAIWTIFFIDGCFLVLVYIECFRFGVVVLKGHHCGHPSKFPDLRLQWLGIIELFQFLCCISWHVRCIQKWFVLWCPLCWTYRRAVLMTLLRISILSCLLV